MDVREWNIKMWIFELFTDCSVFPDHSLHRSLCDDDDIPSVEIKWNHSPSAIGRNKYAHYSIGPYNLHF